MFFKFPSFYFDISRNSCTFAAGKNRHKIMIYFFVQARVGSSRLPNKILLPFYNGKNILELLIEKLQQASLKRREQYALEALKTMYYKDLLMQPRKIRSTN